MVGSISPSGIPPARGTCSSRSRSTPPTDTSNSVAISIRSVSHATRCSVQSPATFRPMAISLAETRARWDLSGGLACFRGCARSVRQTPHSQVNGRCSSTCSKVRVPWGLPPQIWTCSGLGRSRSRRVTTPSTWSTLSRARSWTRRARRSARTHWPEPLQPTSRPWARKAASFNLRKGRRGPAPSARWREVSNSRRSVHLELEPAVLRRPVVTRGSAVRPGIAGEGETCPGGISRA